jgi:hypothetical protein
MVLQLLLVKQIDLSVKYWLNISLLPHVLYMMSKKKTRDISVEQNQ